MNSTDVYLCTHSYYTRITLARARTSSLVAVARDNVPENTCPNLRGCPMYVHQVVSTYAPSASTCVPATRSLSFVLT